MFLSTLSYYLLVVPSSCKKVRGFNPMQSDRSPTLGLHQGPAAAKLSLDTVPNHCLLQS